MAQIKINATYGLTGTLPAVSGANLTTLNASNVSSGTLNASRYVDSGKIGQVVNAVITNDATTTGTQADSNVTASITPSASSSKVLILISDSVKLEDDTGDMGAGFGIKRAISGGATSTILDDVQPYQGLYFSTNWNGSTNSRNFRTRYNITYLDSPSTTSATTYTLMIEAYNINSGGITSSHDNNWSTITLLEVLA